MSESKHVAIVGATGAVGEEMLLCLEQRNFPVGKLTLLASARSAGKKIAFRGEEIVVQELTHESFAGVDIALFSAGGGISLEFGPSAAAAGAVVIDNSSAFRMDEGVPLVVPEINPEAARNHPKGIIANPNCTTIISLMALAPLHGKFGLKSIIASSYQAVSGSGAQGIVELEEQVKAIANGLPFTPKVYPRQIAFNVIPQVDSFTESGYTKEELKMLHEGRKILGLAELKVSCTCVRVPVYRSHSVSITAQFERPVDVAAARAAFAGKPGIQVVDDPANKLFPVPLDTTGKDDCLVGRIRENLVLENALDLWVVGDQVRKGAALNAVQIAELL
ncbi:MAG: aspartate-semialdehyde dehydrogenase [Verrucomicrobia bacterium]|nr:MAG: aspartate-semialdehyde dehydrogenase [Verrucomicrobiota bacterium]TAE85801.1 MAG: aspartate-semialdehyde dehydrogenase [Verrucomicrobiota bacterium]TAF23222.1 MAG: aspartate-semialdehyde dehydrogenase [Verrucomicrobiota bacterium]TAF40051.1 MAG: aspartate-semialdehyde dehydrogenase [Verrucomicrobiota bacterium]